ncbi:NAD(P)-dependent oxidoreductase [Breoghania sp.]|uniref:NAD-dependent epimerase/dehydratase family protein n=1 Tax=Breoghania sp. TaxID=2065378 RepID=UPI002AABC11B|nr:NAD(P)-dependent oxidoreductase [Breoghania sp.]
MANVLVTGATGFLGGHVVERLARQGRSVLAHGRDGRKCEALEAAGHTVMRGDLSLGFEPDFGPRSGKIDAIIHCAALSAPFGRLRDFQRANVEATSNLVTFARQQEVRRFVLISSPSVYFTCADQLGVREDGVLPKPFTPYARTKREAEKIVLAANDIGPIVLRPRGIYGRGDTALVPRLIHAANKGPLPLFRKGAARTDLTYVDDVVSAVLCALNAPAAVNGEVLNISGGEVLPIREVADAACRRAGITPRWKPMPFTPALMAAAMLERACLMLPRAPEPPVTRYGLGLFAFAQSLDITKARTLLGWRPEIGFAEGLERTFQPGAGP